MWLWVKMGTPKTLLVNGKLDQNLRSLGVFFLTHSHVLPNHVLHYLCCTHKNPTISEILRLQNSPGLETDRVSTSQLSSIPLLSNYSYSYCFHICFCQLTCLGPFRLYNMTPTIKPSNTLQPGVLLAPGVFIKKRLRRCIGSQMVPAAERCFDSDFGGVSMVNSLCVFALSCCSGLGGSRRFSHHISRRKWRPPLTQSPSPSSHQGNQEHAHAVKVTLLLI